MNPVFGLILGAIAVYLYFSGDKGNSSTVASDGALSTVGVSKRSGGATAASKSAAQSALSQQTGGAASQSPPSFPSVQLAPFFPAAKKTKEPAANLTSNQSLAGNIQTGQNLAGLALSGLQTAGALPAAPGASAALNPTADAGFLAVKATSNAALFAGDRITTAARGTLAENVGGNTLNSAFGSAGDAFNKAGSILSGATGIGAIAGSVIGNAAISGFRKANDTQRKAILGQSALAGVQTAESVIPGIGTGLSAATGALAKTGEGKRAVAQAGRSLFQGYTAQKDLLKGNVSQAIGRFEGGSTHAQRVKTATALQATQAKATAEKATAARNDATQQTIYAKVLATPNTGITFTSASSDADFLKARNALDSDWSKRISAAGVNGSSLIGQRNQAELALQSAFAASRKVTR